LPLVRVEFWKDLCKISVVLLPVVVTLEKELKVGGKVWNAPLIRQNGF
jgi:hypothetical protein